MRSADAHHRAGEPSQRALRVGEEVRHALAQLLRPGELRDPALYDANITVTEVRLSPDLRNAIAFVMPLAGADVADILAGLRRSAPYLRGRLAQAVRLRHAPNLSFALDHAFDSAGRIATLLASDPVARDLKTGHDDDDSG